MLTEGAKTPLSSSIYSALYCPITCHLLSCIQNKISIQAYGSLRIRQVEASHILIFQSRLITFFCVHKLHSCINVVWQVTLQPRSLICACPYILRRFPGRDVEQDGRFSVQKSPVNPEIPLSLNLHNIIFFQLRHITIRKCVGSEFCILV